MSFVATPNTGQTLGGTRNQMRTNTNLLRAGLAQDHYDVNNALPAPTASGKHMWIDMPLSPTLPTIVTGEGLIYANVYAADTETQLYYNRDGTTGSMTNPPPPFNQGTYQITPCLPVAAAVVFFWNIGTTPNRITIPGPNNIVATATINVKGTSATPVASDGVFRVSPGKYNITFINAVRSANYAILVTPGFASNNTTPASWFYSNVTNIGLQVTFLTNLGGPTDPTSVSVICFGG